MARLLSTILVLGLLGGTAAAFAITEGLKLEKSPITQTRITKLFSPACDCPSDRAAIEFRLRHADAVTATIIRGSETVATLVADRDFRSGLITLRWNGRDASGQMVPDGPYRVRVHLARRHETINLPNTIQVDTAPPAVKLTRVRPRVFSPDHDGRADYVTVGFSVSGAARPLLYVNGKLTARGRIVRSSGKLNWFGKIHGRRVSPGVYGLSLRAEDRAGNVSKSTRPAKVRIRYVALGRNVIRARPTGRFALRVSSDAKLVRWRLNGRTGSARPGTLRLRAPKAPGRYSLFVTSVGHGERVVVIVARGS